MKKLNLYNNNEDISKNQSVYDGFNHFIFSPDRNIFNKLYSRIKFYEMTKEKNGDIVECGVFKGSGLLSWLKILEMNEPNSIKKVIGFDFFDESFVGSLNGIDKEIMQEVFSRCNIKDEDISLAGVQNRIKESGFSSEKFDLVKGDIIKTSLDYIRDKPGFRISILYLDMDLEEPTYNALVNFWDHVIPGGLVVFDEYGYHSWSESNAVDRFCKEMDLELIQTKIKAPSAYLIKK